MCWAQGPLSRLASAFLLQTYLLSAQLGGAHGGPGAAAFPGYHAGWDFGVCGFDFVSDVVSEQTRVPCGRLLSVLGQAGWLVLFSHNPTPSCLAMSSVGPSPPLETSSGLLGGPSEPLGFLRRRLKGMNWEASPGTGALSFTGIHRVRSHLRLF